MTLTFTLTATEYITLQLLLGMLSKPSNETVRLGEAEKLEVEHLRTLLAEAAAPDRNEGSS